MYARPNINGNITTLGVSGKLWRDALIMYDRATGTLWSQVLGRAIAGPATGNTLKELPSELTTWADWKARHPDTLVLSGGLTAFGKEVEKTKRAYSSYARYHMNRSEIGVKGSKNPDKRVGGKDLIYGMQFGDAHAAAPLPQIWKAGGVMNGEPAGAPVVFVSQNKMTWVKAYDRRLGDRVLSFENAAAKKKDPPLLRDQETGSTWNWETGEATDGELAGQRLEPVPGTVAYWGIWAQFHAEAEVVGGK